MYFTVEYRSNNLVDSSGEPVQLKHREEKKECIIGNGRIRIIEYHVNFYHTSNWSTRSKTEEDNAFRMVV